MPNKTEAKERFDPLDSFPEKSNWALVNPIIPIDKMAMTMFKTILSTGKKGP
jgi:hypothetical protein